MKHLDVLSQAGLIAREKDRPHRHMSVDGGAYGTEAMEWLHRYEKFWSARLDQLAAFLEEELCPPTQSAKPSLTSAAATTPRRRGSSARGQTRKK